jgi:predicted Zn-dependent peptidase
LFVFQVSLVGDFDPAVAEKAFLEYMGTIPKREGPLPLPHTPITYNTKLSLEERHVVRLLSLGPTQCTLFML